MNAYAAQDALEERRLEHAAWQDAVNDALCMDADEFMDGLPEHILSPEMEKIMDPIFIKNGKSLDALIEGIRNAYLIWRSEQ
ncbi:TPA: hypothetical protein SD378_001907 [Morganella morganii]|uniref:hypothetical protein n=1 Tax=Morganella morganii TaxID=582 RepID=UPI000DCE162B|nr:hypothetical protein [Morganella morganii]RAX25365.1 hypothetical protein DQ401_16915 [Morganella morganii]HEG4393288.1 hypothetical protein [Morganella morganii]